VLFNSLEFGVYLAIVVFAHFLLIPSSAARARKVLLLLASYAFYASWNPAFVLLLAFSTATDFGLAIAMERTERRGRRRSLVLVSVVVNLGLLGFFKYGSFVAESVLGISGATLPEVSRLLSVALPVGISFYTFQTLSYTIDVYRRRQPATRSLLDFALFVSFFPQLVAGPIVRAGQFLPQLPGRHTTDEDVLEGIRRAAIGLLKKVVLADTLAMYVDGVFETPGLHSGPEVALALYAFSFQIYFDFSGYSDIAIGLGRIFGIRLPENFDRPYCATSVREFWQRWHISFSTWLRDYLYVSLGGNRRGSYATVLNLFITMVLGGLWHGAGWGFVIWGAYQGALLCMHRIWSWQVGERAPRTPAWLRRFATFHLMTLGWVAFRAPTLDVCWQVVRRLDVGGFEQNMQTIQVSMLLALALFHHYGTRARQVGTWLGRGPGWAQGLAYAGAAFLIYLCSGRTGEFIYFQF
jgi:D-alanyl-lipoteichoic acid acyltransferase DltB (MBOAT superfamily)